MNIRTRLLLLVFAVWLPAVASFALLARSTYLREEEFARAELQRLGDNMSAAAEHEIEKKAAVSRTLAASLALREGRLEDFRKEALAAVPPPTGWVVLLTRERQLVNTHAAAGQPLKRGEYRPFAVAGAEVHFHPAGPLTGSPVIGVFVPDPNPQPVLNVAVAFEPLVIQKLVDAQKLPDGLTAAIMDDHRRIMARNRDASKWLGHVATGEVAQFAAAGHNGFLQSVTLDGVRSVSYVSPANRYGWGAVVAFPVGTLAASARRLTLQAVAVSGTLLLIGLGLALFAARGISRPMHALHDAAGHLGRGDVPPKLAATGVAEVDAVGSTLHAAALQAQEAGRVLEQRVREAVAAAEQAQAKLMDGQKHEAIGRLTGGIAHDFNNLLQTISMGLQVVDRATGEGKHRKPLEAAMRACAKAAELVRQMLTFGRAQPLRPQPIALDDFLLKTLELTSKAVGPRIELSTSVAPGTPPVLADAIQLELALLNLVFNARDALHATGRILISAQAANPAATPPGVPGGAVCIEVADNGSGIPPEILGRVFEPYFTTKAVGAGSGLGMAQVRAFARQSGGDVTIDSAPGAGTRVRLFLPAAEAAAVTAPADGAPHAPSRPLRVLMVEDDVLVASVVQPALEAAGHAVTLCRSGDEAKAWLAGSPHRWDVVFSDVVMPGATGGLDLARWVAAERPGLPVLLATGYTGETIDANFEVLRKPYQIAALLDALQHATRDVAGGGSRA